MTTIHADFTVMSAGQDGLVATWGRIEGHLSDLAATVASTGDMSADSLVAYRALADRWAASAEQRQEVLRSLAGALGAAREHYRQVDASLAARFRM